MRKFYFAQLFIEWVGFSAPYILSLVGLDGTSYPIITTSLTEYTWVIPSTIESGLYQVQITGSGICSVLSERFFILTLQDICFVKDTLVETDQGNIPIQHLIPGKHTIFKERIMRVTMSVHIDTHLVHIRAFAFGTYPTKDTIVSQEHKINGSHSFREAREYVNGTTVTLIPYDKEPLYNVLLPKRGFMKVHGMMAETLDPNCNIALADKTKRLLQINI
jgi:hypothetical protein